MEIALIRPLFEEPSPECERTDPWTGPKGFMIGGMAFPTKQDLGQQYFEAATVIMDAIEHNEFEDYKVPNPVLYLYRHFLELTIKDILGSNQHGHDLDELAEKLENRLKGHGLEVPEWVIARIKEFSLVDRRSTAFRYGTSPGGEIYVSFAHLRETMALLYIALSSVAWSGSFPPPGLWEILEEEDLKHPVALAHRIQHRP